MSCKDPFIEMLPRYFFSHTFISIRPFDNKAKWGIAKASKNNEWEVLDSSDETEFERFDHAINALHAFAKKHNLRKADCSCCYYNEWHTEDYQTCTKYGEFPVLYGMFIRPEQCGEHEKELNFDKLGRRCSAFFKVKF